jgi:site-specific DNA-methyltransferase (adenine-specific)
LYQVEPNNIYNMDCLEGMKLMSAASVDMILCDLPYGTTACAWDSVIPFEPMWEQYNRIIKPNGAVVLTASQPFTTALIVSNMANFKYCWVWEKNFNTNFLHAKRMPLRRTEDVVVFYAKQATYNPQKTDGHVPTQSAKGASNGVLYHGRNLRNYQGGDTTRYPTNLLRFPSVDPKKRVHPTQKPVSLFEYLIRTYTNPGELVLDNCMGSGTTAIACLNTGRNYIGFELDTEYHRAATERIRNHRPSPGQTPPPNRTTLESFFQ